MMINIEDIFRNSATYLSCGVDLIEKLQEENNRLRAIAGVEQKRHDTFTTRAMHEQYNLIQAVLAGMRFAKENKS